MKRLTIQISRLCMELWDSFDACGVSSCGIWAEQRPPLRSSRAECSVISEGACMPVQQLTQISAELCCAKQLRTQRTDTKHTTRLHVFVVR